MTVAPLLTVNESAKPSPDEAEPPIRSGSGAAQSQRVNRWRGPSRILGAVALFLMFAAMITTLVVVAPRTAERRSQSEIWKSHTYQVIIAADQLDAAIHDAQGAKRSYVLRGQARDLKQLQALERTIPPMVRKLMWLTRDNPRQQLALAAIGRAYERYLDLLSSSLARAAGEPPVTSSTILESDEGQSSVDALRSRVAGVLAEEQRLLAIRASEARKANRAADGVLWDLAALTGLLMLASLVLLARGLVASDRAAAVSRLAAEEARESREFLQAVIEGSLDPIYVKDLEGRFLLANAQAGMMHDVDPRFLLGRSVDDFLPEEDARRVMGVDREVMQTGLSRNVDIRTSARDGPVRDFQVAKAPWLRDGRVAGLIGVGRDITDRKVSERRVEFANVLLKTQMEASPDAVLVINDAHRVIEFNQRFADMWSIPAAELSGANTLTIAARMLPAIKNSDRFNGRMEHLQENPDVDGLDEIELEDGRRIDSYSVPLHSPAGDYLGRAWFSRDVTERRHAEAEALLMARIDGLTRLANRRQFVEAMQQAIAKANRGEGGFAVIYLDLDHFKDVNDTLGHPAGDELLQAVAGRLRSSTRQGDTVARFGGDEFAIIVANAGQATNVARMADKLIAVLSAPYSIRGTEIYSGASVGIDLYGPHASDAETLLSHADLALYRAKSDGGGSYRFFTGAMDSDVRTRVTLASELREGIARNELFLVYQPQTDLVSGRIAGVEALVRWRHPQQGVLGPAIFIPVAEQMGLIGGLGEWVMKEACRQSRAWIDDGFESVRVCVNLSALQFKAPLALEAYIAAALAASRLPGEMLELELTESVLMNASREHHDLLMRLRGLGVTIAIDDFGTGYSSLDYLQRFPVNRIKIAQTFVDNIVTSSGSAAIVKTTIALGRELGITVIAEGVETLEQLEMLRGWGCDEVQGFYLARPATAEALSPQLRRRREAEQAAARPTEAEPALAARRSHLRLASSTGA